MRSRISVLLLFFFAALPAASLAQTPTDQLGEVSFPTSCASDVQVDFDRAVCAMAWWGVAMTYYHPLWAPPTKRDLELASAAADEARLLSHTKREGAYIEAISAFYRNYETLDHRTRARVYEEAMAEVHAGDPEDREAEIFYVLAILSNADPTDRTYAVQKRTGAMLEARFAEMPNHPGLAHYIIHSYDYPPLADDAVEAAHRYLVTATTIRRWPTTPWRPPIATWRSLRRWLMPSTCRRTSSPRWGCGMSPSTPTRARQKRLATAASGSVR
jgi:hypothetical protein